MRLAVWPLTRLHTGSREESGEAPAAPLETIDLTIELPDGAQLDALAQPPAGVKQEAADADDDEDWEDAASPRTSLAEHTVTPCLLAMHGCSAAACCAARGLLGPSSNLCVWQLYILL